MGQFVCTILYFLILLVGALSCPPDCSCHGVIVDYEVGVDVDCSDRYLERLPSISEGALKLHFSENRLQKIPDRIKLLTELRELDFSNNRLGRYDGIPDNLFSTLVNLKVLNLSENYFSTFSPNSFNGLSQLEKLDLYGNHISHLPLGMLPSLPINTVVCLGHNHWDCSRCEFHETLEWYLSNDMTNICNREVPSCALPPRLESRTFTEAILQEIPACHEEKSITTSLTLISTTSTSDASTELSTVTGDSLKLIVGADYHTTVALPEYYSKSEGVKSEKTPKMVMISPYHRFLSSEDGNNGNNQLLIAAAIVILGVILLIIFLVFSMMLWKMQRKSRRVNISHTDPSTDPSLMVSPGWPLLQGRQLMAFESTETENLSQVMYEEIPFSHNSNQTDGNFNGYVTSNNTSETQLEVPAKQGSEQCCVKVDNPYNTVLLHGQSNPMLANLSKTAWNSNIALKSKSNDKIAASDCTEEAAPFIPLTNGNGLSQSTPYMEMHRAKGAVSMKDLYASFGT